MGAETFSHRSTGKTAKLAFNAARKEALYELGHGGYTGSIAEKDSFVMIPLPEGITPEDYADMLIEKNDPRIDDKWGPAGCIKIKDNEFLFFGWASS